MSPKVAIYCCEPTWRPNGSPLEDQEARCRALAAQADCEVVAVFVCDDGVVVEQVGIDGVISWDEFGDVLAETGAEVLIFETLDAFVGQNYFAGKLIIDCIAHEIGWFSVSDGFIPVSAAYELMIMALRGGACRATSGASPPLGPEIPDVIDALRAARSRVGGEGMTRSRGEEGRR